MDKDVILCPASPRQSDEIRRCLSKLALAELLKPTSAFDNAKRSPNSISVETHALARFAVHEAIGSSRDFEKVENMQPAKRHSTPRIGEKLNAFFARKIWPPTCK
jgi:hypothetical protein